MESITDAGRKIAPTAALPSPAALHRAPSRGTLWGLLPWAASTALLLYLCHFPVAWGWLGWIALTPLLVLVRSQARTRAVFFASWFAGLAFFIPVLQWMRVADPRMYFTWLLLGFYVSFYFPAGVFLVRALDRRRWPLVVALPVAWTALEFLRAHLIGGFPWYFLAHAQHDFLPIIQISDITGAYGVSILVAAVNAVVFEWLWRGAHARKLTLRPAPGRRTALIFQSAVVLFLFAGFLLYGSWRMGQADFAEGPRLALIQGNVEQRVRNASGATDDAERERAIEHIEVDYRKMGMLAATRKPALVIYPETSYMHDWHQSSDEAAMSAEERKELRLLREIFAEEATMHALGDNRPLVLLGLNATEHFPGQEPPRKRYNSALLLGPDGKMAGRYDKIHRVPFGEFVPFRDWLPFMDTFAPYDYDYSIVRGAGQPRLPLGPYHFGVVICYEGTDTVLSREYVNPANGPKVDFLVNISNDGWFAGTAEHEEHLATCRFQAVETRRSIARSVNTGISAVIDGNGRVLAPKKVDVREGVNLWEVGSNPEALPKERWGEFKTRPGILFASVPLDGRESVYSRWGDWLPWICWGILGVVLIAPRVWATRVSPKRG
jgi:apolipoprotein N-acyltransferase